MADTLIYPYQGRETDLKAIKAHTGHWIVWYKNDLDITVPEDIEFVDLTTCDFPGYGNQLVTFGAITENADGNPQMTSTTATVTRTSTGTAQTVYGWALCWYDGVVLWIRRLVKFETPIVISTIGQQLFATATLIQGECP